jgi:hypothetical protein
VRGVTVEGFLVHGFSDSGILGRLADGLLVTGNVTADNFEYGIACFVCSGGTYRGNVVSGSAEGFYQGDSPRANSTMTANEAFGTSSASSSEIPAAARRPAMRPTTTAWA